MLHRLVLSSVKNTTRSGSHGSSDAQTTLSDIQSRQSAHQMPARAARRRLAARDCSMFSPEKTTEEIDDERSRPYGDGGVVGGGGGGGQQRLRCESEVEGGARLGGAVGDEAAELRRELLLLELEEAEHERLGLDPRHPQPRRASDEDEEDHHRE